MSKSDWMYAVLQDPMWDWDEFHKTADKIENTVSRPKDQDQDEPATPPGTQTRSMAWTGYHLTVRELRSWLDKIPDQAILTSGTMGAGDMGGGQVTATWEVNP